MRPITRDEATEVRRVIAKLLWCEPDDIFMADHEHEGLTEGAWSYAAEFADPDQLMGVPWQTRDKKLLPEGLWLECKNSWCLAVYRD